MEMGGHGRVFVLSGKRTMLQRVSSAVVWTPFAEINHAQQPPSLIPLSLPIGSVVFLSSPPSLASAVFRNSLVVRSGSRLEFLRFRLRVSLLPLFLVTRRQSGAQSLSLNRRSDCEE